MTIKSEPILLVARLLVVTFLLPGCAFDLTRIDYSSVVIDKTRACNESFIIGRPTQVNLGTGYSRTVKAGTRWDCIGRVPYGNVLDSKDQLLTVEASNIHEAYIVVSAGTLVGFYLPGKDAYFALDKSVKLAVKYVHPALSDKEGRQL